MVKKIFTRRAGDANGAGTASAPTSVEAEDGTAARQRSRTDPSIAAARRQMAVLLTDVVEHGSLYGRSSPLGRPQGRAEGNQVRRAGASSAGMPSNVFDYMAEHLSAEDIEALAVPHPRIKGSVESYRRAAQCARDYARARALALYRASISAGFVSRPDPRLWTLPPRASMQERPLPSDDPRSSEPPRRSDIDPPLQPQADMD